MKWLLGFCKCLFLFAVKPLSERGVSGKICPKERLMNITFVPISEQLVNLKMNETEAFEI
jgi:hypothetical protein